MKRTVRLFGTVLLTTALMGCPPAPPEITSCTTFTYDGHTIELVGPIDGGTFNQFSTTVYRDGSLLGRFNVIMFGGCLASVNLMEEKLCEEEEPASVTEQIEEDGTWTVIEWFDAEDL